MGLDLEKEAQVSKVMSILEKAPRDESYVPDRGRQGSVIRNLPDDLIYELRGHLHAAHKEQGYFEELRGESGKPFDDKRILRGELFELLCENDPALGKKDEVSKEFLALSHDPARYGAEDDLKIYRNADLATIKDDRSGTVTIQSVGEAKLGLLDHRGYNQVFMGGLRKGVEETSKFLNRNQEGLRSLGLKNLALEKETVAARLPNSQEFIEVADDFKTIVIVPANRGINTPSSFISHTVLERIGANDKDRYLRDVMKRDGINVIRAAFSTQEVAALVEYLAPQIPELE